MVTRRGVSQRFGSKFVYYFCLFVQLFYQSKRPVFLQTVRRTSAFCGMAGTLCSLPSPLGGKLERFSVSFHGLIASSSYIRPHGVSFSQYIHDWHLRQSSPNSIFRSPLFVVWVQLFISPVTFWLTSVTSLCPHRRHYSRNMSWTP